MLIKITVEAVGKLSAKDLHRLLLVAIELLARRELVTPSDLLLAAEVYPLPRQRAA